MATIENKEKEHKQSQQGEKQVFYFNDEGQLVVETNKGVWVDGEKFVKMRGEFVCNAKTMGEIIHQLKGIAVEVGQYEKAIYSSEPGNLTAYCVLGASKERIEEYEKELAKLDRKLAERKAIERFNRLPWWKRIFKKIEIK